MTRKKKTTKKTAGRESSEKTYLSAAELRKFRRLLLDKRAEIFGDVDSMKEETLKKERSDLSNVPFHMADAGSDNFELENTLGLMDEEVKLLVEIDAALERIENKTFGICEGSGKPIPKARLEAIPWARYRVEYKQSLERGIVEPPEFVGTPKGNYDRERPDLEEDEEPQDEENEGKDEVEGKEEDLDEAMERLDEHLTMLGDDEGEEKEEQEQIP